MRRTIVLVCAVAGALFCSAPAHAASTGFNIYNLASPPLELFSVETLGRGGFETGSSAPIPPKVKDVLVPGTSPLHVELNYFLGDNTVARLAYRVPGWERYKVDDPNRYRGFTIYLYSHREVKSTCSPSSREFQCTVEGDTITLLDPPGTVHEVKADKAQDQADVLRMLCNKTNKATCDFTPTSRRKAVANPTVVPSPLANCGEEGEVESGFEAKDTTEITNSVGIELGTKAETNLLFEKLEFSLKLHYDFEITTAHEFKKEVLLRVPPKHLAWVELTAPVIRDTGDFTLKLANTTWNLRGVYFDSPNPDGTPLFRSFNEKLTDAQLKEICRRADGLLPIPSEHVSTTRRGSAGVNAFLGGPESNVVHALAGDDIVRGGGGHDSLFGGAGDDELHGGPGRDRLFGGPGADELSGGGGFDRLVGGPGADTIADGRGATIVRTGGGSDLVDVRDGRGDDIVLCGSRRSTVLADRGDRVSRNCRR